MPIVTFWSNSEKTIGQTVAASVAATVMAMERNYKILLVSVDVNNDSIENCFGSQQSNKNIIKNIISTPKINLDIGTNGLIKMAKSKVLLNDDDKNNPNENKNHIKNRKSELLGNNLNLKNDNIDIILLNLNNEEESTQRKSNEKNEVLMEENEERSVNSSDLSSSSINENDGENKNN